MIFIVLALAALLAVIGYNMYQENQYRKQVREQFGHSDKDALLTSKTKHVRDSKETGGQGLFIKKNKKTKRHCATCKSKMKSTQQKPNWLTLPNLKPMSS
ncbi:hypothetical protein TV01_0892 [Neisseria flavescens]|nr:hypothetical protein TV01_0892 [Neisseria flavescens]